jgi:polyhydroxyalkanoate synthesis repressor PhaR
MENPEANHVKIIKRYQNRKLYDTERSCYVTLNEIAELIKNGEDVKVVDNKSKRDLTSLTLAQIIFEEEKKRKRLLPLGLLKNIIQSSGGSLVDFWKKSVTSKVSSLGQAQEELEGFFHKLMAKGSMSREDGQHLFQSLGNFSQKTLEEFQRRLDEGVRDALGRILPGRNLREEFAQLKEKIALLEEKLDSMEVK